MKHPLRYVGFLLLFIVPHTLANHNPFTSSTEQTPTPSVSKLQLRAYPLQYVDTDTVIKLLEQEHSMWLSSQAHISQSSQNHRIWIEDDSDHLDKISGLIKMIDHPTPQIRIEAELMTINHHEGESLGVQYGTSAGKSSPVANSDTNTFLVPLFTLNDTTQFNMQLQTLVEHGEATLIAHPEIMTLDHQTASIESGQEIPYQQTTSSGGTSVTFKDAALKLQVTPVLLPHQRIQLRLQLNQDTVSSLRVAGAPAITTQQLATVLQLDNHQTLALGGISTQQTSHQHHSIPGLHRLPLLGHLFKDQQNAQQQDELLILLTPHIQTHRG